MAGRLILDACNPALLSNGLPDADATLTFYLNGTTTPQAIYDSADLDVELDNPLECDASGRFPQVWAAEDTAYSVKWTPSDRAAITFDDIATAGNTTDRYSRFLTPQDYGAVGDGVTDDTDALLAWLEALGTGVYFQTIVGPRIGFLPAGKYKFTETLNIPTGTTILGVRLCSVLFPTSAVTTAAVRQYSGTILEGVTIDGTNAAAGIAGLTFGDDGPSDSANDGATRGVLVTNFTGLNSIGCDNQTCVYWDFEFCDFNTNYIGFKLGANGNALLTTNTFRKCSFKSNTKQGLWVLSGIETFIDGGKIENNGEEGILLTDPGAGFTRGFLICGYTHFENNWTSVASGAARHAKYQFVVTAAQQVTVRDIYFQGGANDARAISMADNRSYLLDNVRVTNEAAQIVMSGTAIGSVASWPEVNGSASTTISNGSINSLNPQFSGVNLMAYGLLQTRTWTVAQLPSATDVGNGSRAFVTDSNQDLATGIGSNVAAGGTDKVPVVAIDGAWVIG